MSDKATRESVIKNYQKLKKEGLVDIKYFTGNTDVTEDHFYDQVNKMNIAIETGATTPLVFNEPNE